MKYFCIVSALVAAVSLSVSGTVADAQHSRLDQTRHLTEMLAMQSENMTDVERIDTYEMIMTSRETRTRRRVQVGPPRRSMESRAMAIAKAAQLQREHNKLFENGERSYFMAWNELSDLSDEEYRSFLRAQPKSLHSSTTKKTRRLEQMRSDAVTATEASATADTNTSAIPKNLNWVEVKGGKYMTPIKNQGTCGSCWAFSGITVIESRFAIENDVQASPLSVEQVLGCSSQLDHITSKYSKDIIASSEGCDGGMAFLTYEYMSRLSPHGIVCAASYPYVMDTGARDSFCKSLDTSAVAVKWEANVSDYIGVEENNEDALLRAVMSGPVSTNLDSSGDGFKQYGGGIYDALDCSSDGETVDHAVVVVGFGETDEGDKYWIIRNTWGTMWGEDGHMRITRDGGFTSGPCNLYLHSSYPVKLTSDSSSADVNDGATCSVPTGTFEALSVSKLLSLGAWQCLLLICSSLVCLCVGIVFYYMTENVHNRKEAAGQVQYEDNYKRWILPSREQLAVVLARRGGSSAQV